MFDDYGNLDVNVAKWGKRLILALFIIAVILSGIVTVPAGSYGLLMQGGEPIRTWKPGFHFKIPFIQGLELMNVQIQKAESIESTGTSDLQAVFTTVALNFRLNPDMVIDTFSDFRHEYKNTIIKPSIEESLKATTAHYTAEELITRRADVKSTLDEIMADRLENVKGKQYFIFVAVSLTDFQFNENFQDAIESKVEQEQAALEAINKLKEIEAQAQQKVIQANAQKQADIAQAEGQAIATVLKAEAEANATRLRAEALAYQIQLVNERIAKNPYYIQYEWIQSWDGQLPTTVFGDENIDLLLQGYMNPQ